MPKDKNGAKRQRECRARKAAMDIKVTPLTLSEREREMLTYCCETRGGIRGAYDAGEYIATLIRNDHKKLKRDMSRLGKCDHCKCDLPEGCGGSFNGQVECWHTSKARKLEL